jgi:peptide/nickel transport system permease protein
LFTYILRKLWYGFFVLLGVVCVVFLLFNVLPGDPARMMLGQRADAASIEAINKELGRDKSLTEQFLMYANDLSPLSVHDTEDKLSLMYFSRDKYASSTQLAKLNNNKIVVLKYPYLRRSYQTKRKVSDIIFEALPETFALAVAAILFASIVGVALGILSAIYKNTWIDNSTLVMAVLGMSGPSFFIGIIVAWVFGFILSDYTGLNMTGSLYTIDPFIGEQLDLKNIILPALTLGIRPLAVIIQLTRNSLLDVMSQDFIRTATAKGLSYQAVIFKHALRNSLTPVITAISGWFASLLAGSVFIEYVFGWKGIGAEVVGALEKYDFPVVMGTVLVISILFVIINIMVDIIYGIFDPRVRFN